MSEMEASASFAGPVAVLGAGTMGQGIATACLLAGLRTVVVDMDDAALARGRAAIGRAVRHYIGIGTNPRLDRDDPAAALRRLDLSTDLAAAVRDVGAVIEAVPEILSLKLDIFSRLGEAAPGGALLASNTSTMSISAMAQACANSSRVVGMHFFNPAHRMPLVEVVAGAASADSTVEDAVRLARALGKDPIVARDLPGFVTSRLGLLLGTEAMRMVQDGVATPADIDKAMRLGYGHPMGPLALADLVGLDARLNNLRSMYERSGSAVYRAPEILERLVALGHLGRKTGAGFFEYDASGRIVGSGPATTLGRHGSEQ